MYRQLFLIGGIPIRDQGPRSIAERATCCGWEKPPAWRPRLKSRSGVARG